MIIITDNGLPIHIEETKAGGRILRTLCGATLYKKYTHPSRSQNISRFTRDIRDIESAAKGNKVKSIKVTRV